MGPQAVDVDAARRADYGSFTWRYTERDVVLYALSLGCHWDEARYVYENAEGFGALPTFGVLPPYHDVLPSLPLHRLVPNFNPVRSWHSSECRPAAAEALAPSDVRTGARGSSRTVYLVLAVQTPARCAEPMLLSRSVQGCEAGLRQYVNTAAAQMLLLHGEQYLELGAPFPPAAALRTTPRILDIQDKGKAAVVVIATTSVDEASGAEVAYNEITTFLRGAGGFARAGGAGDAGPARRPGATARHAPPDRPPDAVVEVTPPAYVRCLAGLRGAGALPACCAAGMPATTSAVSAALQRTHARAWALPREAAKCCTVGACQAKTHNGSIAPARRAHTHKSRRAKTRRGPPIALHTVMIACHASFKYSGAAQERTSEDQAALYRLNGDYNPLHIDAEFAGVGGFARPILHGLCTYGVAAKHVLQRYGGGEPGALHSIKARLPLVQEARTAAKVCVALLLRAEGSMSKPSVVCLH
jgi:acyl dehydratase